MKKPIVSLCVLYIVFACLVVLLSGVQSPAGFLSISAPEPAPVATGGGGGGGSTITDTFSTDTTANYTTIVGSSLAIADGYATMGADLWNGGVLLNNTALSSPSHYIDFIVEILTDSNVSVVVRSNGVTAYMLKIYYDQTQWSLESWDGSTASWVGTFATNMYYPTGFHRFRLEANGPTFTLKHWNGTSWDQVGDRVISTLYTSGNKVGLMFSNNGEKARIDSYEAGTL